MSLAPSVDKYAQFELNFEYKDSETYNTSQKHEQYRLAIPKRSLIDFHALYYYGNQCNVAWMGYPMIKFPSDLIAYQHILFDLKPDLIVETGTFRGGSALYFATLCDAMKHGRVISIDIDRRDDFPAHERITYLTGSSTSDEIVGRVVDIAKSTYETVDETASVFLILDSDHRKPHVLRELFCYERLADYIVVEDGNINGHPVRPQFGEGPYEAVEEFLAIHKQWTVDRERIPLLTVCPNSYLKRV